VPRSMTPPAPERERDALDLSVRVRLPELMDDPRLDPLLHREALGALARIDRVSFGARRAVSELERIAPTVDGPVSVLDVACGGGDTLRELGLAARRRRIGVELHGCDRSEVALDHARERATAKGIAVALSRLDVLEDPLPGDHHLVLSSLFLHHLAEDDAVRLLRSMAEATRRTLLVQDLRRTRTGLALAWLGLHTLTRSPVARVDGIRSVRAAFTTSEAGELCRRAGLDGARVLRRWPQRFMIRWEAS